MKGKFFWLFSRLLYKNCWKYFCIDLYIDQDHMLYSIFYGKKFSNDKPVTAKIINGIVHDVIMAIQLKMLLLFVMLN